MISSSFALVGDLVASRQMPHRSELAERIKDTLARVNQEFHGEWVAELGLTKGMDELSAVLRRPRHAFDILVALNLDLWPAHFRLCVAEGELDVGEVGDPASRFDGLAFHRASAAMGRAHREKRPLALDLHAGADLTQSVVEESARLHQTIMQAWTPAAHAAARLARRTGASGEHPTQVMIAGVLNISQPAVSHRLRLARHPELVATEEAIRNWLEQVGH